MLTNPRPTPLLAPIPDREVAEHRNLFCDCYDLCLDEAVTLRWPSWTCAFCRRFAAHARAGAAVSAGEHAVLA